MKIHLKTETTMICPDCGHRETESMPLDACTYFYECKHCEKLMTPQTGDCCVFCSRGTTPCPTSQRESRYYSIMLPTTVSANEETASYDRSSNASYNASYNAIQTG